MFLTFIVTTYNVDSYIEQCLDSVVQAAWPGDEIIIVDDGSTDMTARNIKHFAETRDVTSFVWRPLFLGVSTHGGVGIPANVALDQAQGEIVFFVDGDDWVDPEAFKVARARFENGDDDILIANYREFDQVAQTDQPPADQFRWAEIAGIDAIAPQLPVTENGTAPMERRIRALELIAAPWRKFYRRDMLERHAIRFAEGDFFFEDNPFHWDACLKAERIGFFNAVVCYHRVNRPGQTMMALDQRLLPFFDHYERILGKLPPLAVGDKTAETLHAAAMDWLVNNMTWHLQRIDPEAYWDYALRAGEIVRNFDETVWTQRVAPKFSRTRIGRAIAQLRQSSTAAVVTLWMAERQIHLGQDLQQRMTRLEDVFNELGQITDRLETLRAQAEWRALKEIGAERAR